MPYIIAIVIIVIAAVGFAFMQNKSTASEVTTDTVQTTDTPAANANGANGTNRDEPSIETPAPTVTSGYKDGTYKSQMSYFTPLRDEYLIDVSLTIKDDVVTAATVAYSQGAEVDPNAKRFEDAYRTEVIGKDIGTLNLSRVGGASLTTGAFNKALAEIKVDAEA